MDVSENSGTPKWMVKIMENPINPWIVPLFLETPKSRLVTPHLGGYAEVNIFDGSRPI